MQAQLQGSHHGAGAPGASPSWSTPEQHRARLADEQRLAWVDRLELLQGDDLPALERITRLAAAAIGVPTVLVSLVEVDRQRFPSHRGLAEPWAARGETPLTHSLCQYVVSDASRLTITDARIDPRVRDSLAIPDLGVVAYAGVPLRAPTGEVLGAFCVIDDQPRSWTDQELAMLDDLTAAVESELALRLSHRALEAASRRTQAILECAQDAYVCIDADGVVADWNPSAERMLGWSAAEAIGTAAVDLFVPDRFVAAHEEGLRWAMSAGTVPGPLGRIELVVHDRDRRELAVEMSLQAGEGATGGVVLHGFLRDISERTEAAETVLRERTFQSALLDSLDVGVVACDGEGRLALLNRAARGIHALSDLPDLPGLLAGDVDQLTAPHWFQSDGRTPLSPEDLPLRRASRGEPVRAEEIVVAPPGREPRRFQVNSHAITLPERTDTIGAVVAMHEVTEQHRSATARSAYAGFVFELMDTDLDGDPMARALEALRSGFGCRRTAYWLGGAAEPDLIAGPPLAVTGRDAILPVLVAEAATRGEPTWRDLRVAGRQRAIAIPVRSDDLALGVLTIEDDGLGSPPPQMLAVLDAVAAHIARHVERRRIDELSGLLAREREAWNRAISQVDDYVWTVEVHPDGSVESVYASPRATGVLGGELAPGTVASAAMLDQVVPEDVEELLAFCGRLHRGEPTDVEVGVRGFDGVVRWVWTRGVPRREDGRLFVDGISTDVTERRVLAEQREQLLRQEREQVQRLQELDQLKDEFLALVSHELRNPVAAISGYADLLREEPELRPQALRALSVIDRRSRQLLQLVNGLFDHAQMQAGLVQLQLAWTALDALVDEVATVHRRPAHEAGLTLEVTSEVDREVYVDADKLRQVLDNVIGNAVKYTPTGGSISVSAACAGPAVVINVTDTGIGVPAEEYPLLFDRLFRGSTARAHGIEGTGLGLALTRSLVEAHGGMVEAHPRPGGGTVVTVVLPWA